MGMNGISRLGQVQAQDKNTMLSSKMTLSNSKPPAESIRERLMKLFTLSEDTRSAERGIERRVSELVHAFLSSPRVSSEVDLQSLLESFSSSRMPGGACDVEEYVDAPRWLRLEVPALMACDVEEYVDALAKQVVTHAINTASPRYIGHMTSALPYFVRPLGKRMPITSCSIA